MLGNNQWVPGLREAGRGGYKQMRDSGGLFCRDTMRDLFSILIVVGATRIYPSVKIHRVGVRDVSLVVKCLPITCAALDLLPSTVKITDIDIDMAERQ